MFGPSTQTLLSVATLACLFAGGPRVWAKSYPPSAGEAHPQIMLPTVDGDRVIALSSFRARKVLLVHFASWCEDCRKEVPAWYEKTKGLVESNELVVLGITQEQHADRCRLFAQWKGIDWPILHDPFNLVGIEAVPAVVAVDEHGVVRNTKLSLNTFGDSFVSKKFAAGAEPVEAGPDRLPDLRLARGLAHEARNPASWQAYGDALVLAGGPGRMDEAIEAYHWARKLSQQRAGKYGAKDAGVFFRLGVAYRIRCERPERQPGDFQAAVDAWQKALELRPDNEIFRRRIQQYGPRVDKPYSFYKWVAAARKDIAKRGETPVELSCEPCGAERAFPADKFKRSKKKGPKRDSDGKAKRDSKDLIEITQTVVHGTDKKNRNVAQVHLAFRPNAELDVHWNNEAEPLRLWIKTPKTGRVSRRFVEYPNPTKARSNEARTLNFEVKLPSRQKGTLTVKAYALYNACEGEEGKSQLFRQDAKVKIKL